MRNQVGIDLANVMGNKMALIWTVLWEIKHVGPENVMGNHVGIYLDNVMGNHVGIYLDNVMGNHVGIYLDNVMGNQVGLVFKIFKSLQGHKL